MATNEAVQVFVFPDARLMVRVSPATLPGTPEMQIWNVRCGFNAIQCTVVPDPTVRRDQVYMSTGLLGRLHMTEIAAPMVARREKGEFRIGPMVGILCNPRWNSNTAKLAESTQLPALEKLLDAAQQAGVPAFLFRVEDVDFQNLMVKGYFRTSRGFRRRKVPLPDVIYDQLISRKRERTLEHAKLREKLSRLYGNRIFNDGFFDKWQVHEWLSSDKRLTPHIPDTIRYTHSQQAAQFIKRHPTVYMKPVHGSLGLGIVRVMNQPDGSYVHEIKRPNQSPIAGRSSSSSEFVKSFRKRFAGRPYLLQQGIGLATVDGRPFDVRILLQRDGTGEWKRTKSFARLTKAGDITSNLSSGGEALSLHAVLERLFSNARIRNRCKAEVHKVSRLVAEAMEQQSGKTFGELGIDLGIDTNGRVWVIEVNSKPWKSPTTEKGSQEIVDLAFERPIRYALWLSEQK